MEEVDSVGEVTPEGLLLMALENVSSHIPMLLPRIPFTAPVQARVRVLSPPSSRTTRPKSPE